MNDSARLRDLDGDHARHPRHRRGARRRRRVLRGEGDRADARTLQARPRAAVRQPLDERRPDALRHRDLDGQRRDSRDRAGRRDRPAVRGGLSSPGGRASSTGERGAASALANQVLPEEIARPESRRLRLTGPAAGSWTPTTSTVASSTWTDRTSTCRSSFAISTIRGVVAAWTRSTRNGAGLTTGRDMRPGALAQRLGALRGGSILVRPAVVDVPVPLTLTVESTSLRGVEEARVPRR